MKIINSEIQAQLDAGIYAFFSILDMDIDSTHYRYTDCDISLRVGGYLYTKRPFKVPEVFYSQGVIIEQIKINLIHLDTQQDQDEVSTLTPIFVGGTPQGSTVILGTVIVDLSDYSVYGDTYLTLFNGLLGEWTINEKEINITCTSLLDQWAQRTLSFHPPSCRWKVFKGTECGYVGAETECDRSYVRCDELSNTDNFGGFRWLPSIVDKAIWWGKETIPPATSTGGRRPASYLYR